MQKAAEQQAQYNDWLRAGLGKGRSGTAFPGHAGGAQTGGTDGRPGNTNGSRFGGTAKHRRFHRRLRRG